MVGLCRRGAKQSVGRCGEHQVALQPANEIGLQLRARHHGHAAYAHLCDDDLHLHRSRKGKRHHGSPTRFAHSAACHHRGQGGSLPHFGLSHPHLHSPHVGFRAPRAGARIAVLDLRRFHPLHPVGTLVGTVGFERGPNATRRSPAVRHGIDHAYHHVSRACSSR